MKKKTTLKEAINFHGHLGPYLVLGLIAGEVAVKKLSCKKHFGIEVMVSGATKKPKSCLIDGLQLSTGATYGKGNITKSESRVISVVCRNCKTKKEAILNIRRDLLKKLKAVNTHRDSEALAKKLYNTDYKKIFNLRLKTYDRR